MYLTEGGEEQDKATYNDGSVKGIILRADISVVAGRGLARATEFPAKRRRENYGRTGDLRNP